MSVSLLVILFAFGALLVLVGFLAANDGKSVSLVFYGLSMLVFGLMILAALSIARNGYSTENLDSGTYTVLSVTQTEKTVLVLLAADPKVKMGSGILFEVPTTMLDISAVAAVPPSPAHVRVLIVLESGGMKVLQLNWVLPEKP